MQLISPMVRSQYHRRTGRSRPGRCMLLMGQECNPIRSRTRWRPRKFLGLSTISSCPLRTPSLPVSTILRDFERFWEEIFCLYLALLMSETCCHLLNSVRIFQSDMQSNVYDSWLERKGIWLKYNQRKNIVKERELNWEPTWAITNLLSSRFSCHGLFQDCGKIRLEKKVAPSLEIPEINYESAQKGNLSVTSIREVQTGSQQVPTWLVSALKWNSRLWSLKLS